MAYTIEKMAGSGRFALTRNGKREVIVSIKNRKIKVLYPKGWSIEQGRPLSKVEMSLVKKH